MKGQSHAEASVYLPFHSVITNIFIASADQ